MQIDGPHPDVAVQPQVDPLVAVVDDAGRGQLLAWQQLSANGYVIDGNPATSFFYLLTALHGLHLLGGMWVWGRTTVRLFSGADAKSVRLSVELCTVYWHYLLLVWIGLFGLLLST